MTTIGRQSLRFAEAVEENFSFLAAHGFKCVQSEPTFVRFESEHDYVNIYHGRKSFELGLEIGPSEASGSDERPYPMSGLIRLVEPSKADEYRNYATHTADGVAEGVQRLAALFRRYVDAGVLDDATLYSRLEENRKAWSRDYATKVKLGQARRKVEIAWHAKDYLKVVTLLRPLRDALTPAERQKLDFAEKHSEAARR
jgi:hypothetical protein